MKKYISLLIIILFVSIGYVADDGTSGARYFDGTDDVINCGNPDSLNPPTAITIAVWVKPTTLSNAYNHIINKWYDGDSMREYLLAIRNTRLLTFGIGHDEGLRNTAAAWARLNEWQHIAATYDGTDINIYYNGESVYSAVYSTPIPHLTNNVIIGRSGYNETAAWFNGTIDEVYIFNKALGQAEVKSLMKYGAAGQKDGLVLGYDFNEDSGGLFDMSYSYNNSISSSAGTTSVTGRSLKSFWND